MSDRLRSKTSVSLLKESPKSSTPLLPSRMLLSAKQPPASRPQAAVKLPSAPRQPTAPRVQSAVKLPSVPRVQSAQKPAGPRVQSAQKPAGPRVQSAQKSAGPRSILPTRWITRKTQSKSILKSAPSQKKSIRFQNYGLKHLSDYIDIHKNTVSIELISTSGNEINAETKPIKTFGMLATNNYDPYVLPVYDTKKNKRKFECNFDISAIDKESAKIIRVRPQHKGAKYTFCISGTEYYSLEQKGKKEDYIPYSKLQDISEENNAPFSSLSQAQPQSKRYSTFQKYRNSKKS